MSATDSGQDPFDRVAEAFLAQYRAGARPSVTEYARRYPELATEIRDLFPALVELEEGRPAAPAPAAAGPDVPRQLGDFRILREVGRGGMGVVYEAVQESLGRHVALKVLPPQAVPDPLRLRRFRREARSVARLHHTNIVPVHEVGAWQGVHYYAMQFIRGQGLDQVLQEVRRLRGPPTAGPTAAAPPATACLARGLLTGRFRAGKVDPCAGPPTTEGDPPLPAPSTAAPVSPASGPEFSPQDNYHYSRSVAGLGLQAAEALAYAHGQGVLHRDIKPSNLLLDDQGRVWLTDFGLAKEEAGDDVTGTGDLVGTLRYIAPERFRGQTDARSDVYSLGLTLYELLTLRPAFADTDRHELVRRVTQEEPPRPRQLDRRIPRDLETIVLKATAREPARRYPSAAELAEDLRRFLDDRPIQARRPTLLHKIQKWSRRNRAVVRTAAAGLLATAAVLAGSLGWVVRDRTLRREQAAREATAAREDIDALRREGKWAAARTVARRAEALLADADPDLRREFTELGRDLEMAARLEEIRLRESEVQKGPNYDLARADPEYARAFRDCGIDVEALTPAQAAERIQARAIREELAAALDDWAGIRGATDEPSAHRLRAVARAADPDPERNRLRDALESGKRQALEELAASEKVDGLPPSTLVLLAEALLKANAGVRAEAVLRRAQQLHPDDFWINQALGFHLYAVQPSRPEDAARFFTAAVALHPQSPGVHLNLGNALWAQRKLPEAVDEYRRAIQLQPDFAVAHYNLGNAWCDLGKPTEAVEEYRRAIQVQPDFAMAYCGLGGARAQLGQWEQAAADYARGFDLGLPENPYYGLERACLLLQLGDAAGYRKLCARMREHFGRSREPAPLAALAHTCAVGPEAFPDAGLVLRLAQQRQAVAPPVGHDPWSKHVLGLAYYRAGRYDQAAACLGQALQDEPNWEHKVLNWLVLAMAEQRLDHGAAARRWLDRAEEWVKHKTVGAGQGGMAYHVPGWKWRDALMVQLFRREAEALLGRAGPNNPG